MPGKKNWKREAVVMERGIKYRNRALMPEKFQKEQEVMEKNRMECCNKCLCVWKAGKLPEKTKITGKKWKTAG